MASAIHGGCGLSSLIVIPGYTVGVKTAVSIPDDLFESADRLARRRRMSRSALYAEALKRLIDSDDTEAAITARLDAIYSSADSQLDAALAVAQAEALRERW